MIDLSRTAGIPVWFNPEAPALELGPDLRREKVVLRRLHEMLPMLQEASGQDSQRLLYFMNYNLRFPEHEQAFVEGGLRYDITVLLPGEVGPEPVKTAGHYHPAEATHGVEYPEIYSVLAGSADYLLQRTDVDGTVTEALLLHAEAGEHVLIPPGYGHISINRGPGPMIMANLVASDCQPDYGPIRLLGGGCYLPKKVGDQLTYSRNEKYASVVPLQHVRPIPLPEYGIEFHVPLYTAYVQRPTLFQYVALPGSEGGTPSWTSDRFWS